MENKDSNLKKKPAKEIKKEENLENLKHTKNNTFMTAMGLALDGYYRTFRPN